VEQHSKLFSFFSYPSFSSENKTQSAPEFVQSSSSSAPGVKGLYLWGGSGCGKTYLSDIFYHNLPIKEKSKIHFHEFMANIQKDLFKLEKV
jgi:predicted ATPase